MKEDTLRHFCRCEILSFGWSLPPEILEMLIYLVNWFLILPC